jgi:pimeloyl-ACP methyl ester carboxylesterase
LFLLHGVGLSADTFIRNIDALGEQFSVYAPDLLGHGFTDAVDFGNATPQLANARMIGRLADELGVQRYSVGGSSFGALVAALMWFERPRQVSELILIGSGSAFHPADEQEKTLKAAFANAAAVMADPTLASCRQRLAAICHEPESVASDILLTQLTSYAISDRFDAYKRTIEGVISSLKDDNSRVLSRLESIHARTLIITGRDDIRSQWSLHIAGRKRIPHSRIVILDKCGHLPYMEHPEIFNKTVDAFLRGDTVGE